jgi:hypothetical protein
MISPRPQNEVERALLGAGEDDFRYEDFMRALTVAEVLIPQPHVEGVAPGEHPVADGDELALPLVEHEGNTYVPVFTSIEQFRLGIADAEASFVRLPVRGLVGEWPEEHGMAVNPGGDIGVALDSRSVRALADPPAPTASSKQRFAPGSKVLLGEPTEEPTALLEAVANECGAHGGVRAAYRALMAPEGDEDKPQTVIGVELDSDVDAERFFGEMGPRVAPAAAGAFSLVVVDETNLTSVARYMLLETDPFFVRNA